MRACATLLVLVLMLIALPAPRLGAGPLAEQHAIAAGSDIVLQGEIRVRGDVHANGNVVAVGRVTIEGTAEAGNRVALEGGAAARRVAMGVPATAIPNLDFANLRRQARSTLNGDQTLRGFTIVSGVTYVVGSATIDGVLAGSGTLAAEGSITLRNAGTIPTAVNLVARDRLLVQGAGIRHRGLVQSPNVLVTGDDITLSGPVIGQSVHVQGNRIEIGTGALTVLPFPLPIPLPIPVPGGIVSGVTIDEPKDQSEFEASGIRVTGAAAPGATVRVTVTQLLSGREVAAREVQAGLNGRYETELPHAGLGFYRVTAAIVGPAGRIVQETSVTIRIRDLPERG